MMVVVRLGGRRRCVSFVVVLGESGGLEVRVDLFQLFGLDLLGELVERRASRVGRRVGSIGGWVSSGGDGRTGGGSVAVRGGVGGDEWGAAIIRRGFLQPALLESFDLVQQARPGRSGCCRGRGRSRR